MTTTTTETPSLTLDAIFDTVRGLLAASPDFTYETPLTESSQCVYIHEGKGSCVVGQALVELGVPVNTLAAYDSKTFGGIGAMQVLRDLLGDVAVADDPKARAIDLTQSWQDSEYAWGGALPMFETVDNGGDNRAVADTYYDLAENYVAVSK